MFLHSVYRGEKFIYMEIRDDTHRSRAHIRCIRKALTLQKKLHVQPIGLHLCAGTEANAFSF